jgi:hypothetical protein
MTVIDSVIRNIVHDEAEEHRSAGGDSWSAHAAGDAVDGSPRRPSAIPGTAASASTGGLRHRTSGVGIGAIAIAWTSTSVFVLISVDLQEHVTHP